MSRSLPIVSGFRVSTHREPSDVAGTRLVTAGCLSLEERGALEEAVSRVRNVAAGAELGREGLAGSDLNILVAGWACRYKSTHDGHRQLTALLLAGDICNLDCLLFDRTDYGVRMLTDGSVLTLSRARAQALAARYPGIARSFTRLALVENAALRQWALNLGRRFAIPHLAHFFCELVVRLEEGGNDRGPHKLPLGRDLLADVLGLTPIHVSRAMKQLHAEGLVVSNRGTITIIDVDGLRRIGKFDPAYLHLSDVS